MSRIDQIINDYTPIMDVIVSDVAMDRNLDVDRIKIMDHLGTQLLMQANEFFRSKGEEEIKFSEAPEYLKAVADCMERSRPLVDEIKAKISEGE